MLLTACIKVPAGQDCFEKKEYYTLSSLVLDTSNHFRTYTDIDNLYRNAGKDSNTEYQYYSSFEGNWILEHTEYSRCFNGKPLQIIRDDFQIDRIILDKPAYIFMFDQFWGEFLRTRFIYPYRETARYGGVNDTIKYAFIFYTDSVQARAGFNATVYFRNKSRNTDDSLRVRFY